MEIPKLSLNLFIVENDIEGTQVKIDEMLAFLLEYEQGQTYIFQNSEPTANSHHFGFIYVLEGLREAVKYMGDIANDNSNVTSLEVKS